VIDKTGCGRWLRPVLRCGFPVTAPILIRTHAADSGLQHRFGAAIVFR
jgi:hypothetical protein